MNKLTEHKEEHQTRKKGLKIFLGVAVAFLIILLLLVIIQVPYTTDVTYTEKEPNTNNQCNYVDYDYRLTESSVEWVGSANSGWRFEQDISLENLENQDGCWSGHIAVFTNEVLTQSFPSTTICVSAKNTQISKTGYPTGAQTSLVSPDNRLNSKFIVEKAPQKQVCSDVVNYQDVQKTRTETRYCSALKKLFRQC